MWSARDKNPLNTPIAMFGEMLERSFIWTLVITGLRYHKIGLSCSLLLHQEDMIVSY